MPHSELYKRIMNSREWRELRNRKRLANPFCEACMERGIVVPMHAVHHIKEIESARTDQEAWETALAWNNLQSLCAECHKDIHIGSHKKEAHKQRQKDRLSAWASAQTGGSKKDDTPGGI